LMTLLYGYLHEICYLHRGAWLDTGVLKAATH